MGHVLLDLATGERVVTPFTGADMSVPVWLNDFTNENTQNANVAAALNQFGIATSEWLDWGDIPFDTRVTAWNFGYITNFVDPGLASGSPEPTGVPGLKCIMTWYDGESGSAPGSPNLPDPDVLAARGLVVDNLFGAPPGGQAAWIFTVSVPDGLEFELGDTDGSATSNDDGPNRGVDEDGDTLADFGFSYSWSTTSVSVQNRPLGEPFLGPIVVLPGNAQGLGLPASQGVEDRIAIYLTRRKVTFLSFLDQGGFNPVPGDWRPFTSLYAEFFGEKDTGGDCFADLTTTGAGSGDPDYGVPDGEIDLSDLLYFVNRWQADEIDADVTTTGASLGDPGYGTPDGEVDLADLLYFVNAWTSLCGES